MRKKASAGSGLEYALAVASAIQIFVGNERFRRPRNLELTGRI
jgi:hypothetical protein